MQENEFEKKLQQKLEMLQVQPAAEVWLKVKSQVAQKKKKRRFAFFFLLAFMLCAGGLVTNMLLNKPVNDSSAGNAKIAGDEMEIPADKDLNETKPAANSEANKDVQKATASEKKSALAAAIEDATGNTIPANNKTIGLETNNNKNSSAVRKPIKRNTKAQFKVAAITPQVDEDETEIAQSNYEKKASSQATTTVKTVEKEEGEVAVADSEGIKEITVTDLNAEEKTKQDLKKESEPEKAAVITKENKKKSNDRKWGIGFSFAAGINKVGSSSMSKSFSQEDYNGGVSGNPNTPTAGLNSSSVSPMQPGYAFATGIQVYRKLGNSLKLTMGLQYNYSSLLSKTGKRLDTTAAVRFEMYQTGSSVNYTNRYHYLTIPVSLSARLFSIGNREIWMDAGASLSQLVGTNALSFNSAQERYFTGVHDLNNTVLSLSAALAINLANSNKPAFYIGPQVNYALTSMAAGGLHQGMHPLFVGIRVQKNLWK